MKNLVLEATNVTPIVNFDYSTGKLEITGTSYPEDSYFFYKPLLEWLQSYSKKPSDVTEAVFKMDYFNTSSTVFILKFLKGVTKLKQVGKTISIKWYYKQDDEEMYEAGRDFGVLAEIPIELIAY